MKLTALACLSGPGVLVAPGDVIERDEAEALRLIKAGFATPVNGGRRERATPQIQRETRDNS